MSKLEPTRTCSNPTATDILRRMLDERGVEWWEATPCKTKWNSPIIGGPVAARERNGEMVLDTGYIAVTPEQAIAATVGSDKVEAVLRKLIAQLGIAADFHFARKYVDCIVEEYAGKLATLGTGTCKRVFYEPTGVYVCSECGRGLSKKLDKYCYLHYCPNCGRRIEQ